CPRTATGPVSGPSRPIDATHDFVLAVALLLLLPPPPLLPQPAATSAPSVVTAMTALAFMGTVPHSSGMRYCLGVGARAGGCRRPGRAPGQSPATLASSVISVPARARATVQSFARCARSLKDAASTPGTSPTVCSSMRVMLYASPACASVTRAVVVRSRTASPASPSRFASDIVKHAASAAPTTSSGLVTRSPPSTRARSEYEPVNAPLPSAIRPDPSARVPCQLAWALRAMRKLNTVIPWPNFYADQTIALGAWAREVGSSF